MQSKPYARFRGFAGINNMPETLLLPVDEGLYQWLKEAQNIDIDNNGIIKFPRNGQTSWLSGDFHSIKAFSSLCLAVKGTDLVRLYSDKTYTVLASGFNQNVSYAFINDVAYLTDNKNIGYVENGTYRTFPDPWDYDLPQPVIDDYRATRIKMPAGQLIEYYNGRLYVARGSILYISDPMAFGRVNIGGFETGYGIYPLNGYITLLKAVDDGLWVSTGKITFLSGKKPDEFVRLEKAPYAAIADGAEVREDLTDNASKTVIFTSEKGLCYGFSGGGFKNLTEEKYLMPSGYRTAGLYRKQSQTWQYITVIEN